MEEPQSENKNSVSVFAKNGRPSMLTQEVSDQICTALRAGNYQEIAARFAGISETSYWRWLDRGRKERTRVEKEGCEPSDKELRYYQFACEVDKARAASEVRYVGLIANAASETWQAAAWYLERSRPAKWGRRDRHEITGAEGNPLEVSHIHKVTVEVDIDRAAAILSALSEAGIIDAEIVDEETPEYGQGQPEEITGTTP